MTTIMLGVTWVINYVRRHKQMVAILAAILVIALLSILLTRSCGRKPVLNEKELQEIHEAIESKERGKMEDAFVKVEAKQAEIEANVTNSKAIVVNAQYEAKKKVEAMTDEELAAYLESLK